MTETNELLTLHPFESAGLGQAPFRCVGVRENVYSACPGHVQAGGSCKYCGQGIRYECVIQSSDGKTFVVGMDCVRKVYREDNRVLQAAERAMAKINKAKRDASREAKREAQRVIFVAELDRQRAANGGLTDYEVNEARIELERKAAEAKHAEANKWLIDAIDGMPGDFAASMVEKLKQGPLGGLSDRMLSCLCEMYAKTHGRRGSKAFATAETFFWNQPASTQRNNQDD